MLTRMSERAKCTGKMMTLCQALDETKAYSLPRVIYRLGREQKKQVLEPQIDYDLFRRSQEKLQSTQFTLSMTIPAAQSDCIPLKYGRTTGPARIILSKSMAKSLKKEPAANLRVMQNKVKTLAIKFFKAFAKSSVPECAQQDFAISAFSLRNTCANLVWALARSQPLILTQCCGIDRLKTYLARDDVGPFDTSAEMIDMYSNFYVVQGCSSLSFLDRLSAFLIHNWKSLYICMSRRGTWFWCRGH